MAAARLALSVFVLMLAVISLSEAMRGAGPKKCCFNFNDAPVAKSRVVSYTRTSQRCTNPAILLKMAGGRLLCVRSSDTWVKNLINYLDSKAVIGQGSPI